MFFRQFTYLVALANERHFGRAAESCNVSQPALSAAIRNMEEELGLPIVQRRGRSFEGFTHEGERLLAWARQILADWSHLQQEASGARHELGGRLRIGAIPTALPVVSLLTAACLAQYPRMRHTVHALSTGEIIRQLGAFELDVALGYVEDDRLARFRTLPLYRERYVLFARKVVLRNPRAAMGWRQAAALPLCLLTDNMQNRRYIDAAFNQAGVRAEPLVETDSISALYTHAVNAGLVGIVAHSVLGLFGKRSGFDVVPLVPQQGRPIGLIARGGEPASPIVDAVWSIFGDGALQGRFDALISAGY